ncbi:MAG: TIGR03013 family PEP-CTERM/XrtA system glycosyltransferase [Acidobacteria bacterium]|nr:TIGR03013 family PEP-CTERM/XrtA system glycosyltransferase [Acidobacteriota bacterium]
MAKGLMQPVTWRSSALILSETALIIAAVIVSTYVVLGSAWSLPTVAHLLPKVLLIGYVCQICLYYGDLYDDPRMLRDLRHMMVRLLQALGATSILLALLYAWYPDLIVARGVFVLTAAIVGASLMGWRLAFRWATVQVGPRERLLLVGRSATAHNFERELAEHSDNAVEVVGFVEAQPGDAASQSLGAFEDLPAIVRAHAVDRVVVNLADARGKLPMDKLLEMKLQGVTFADLASVYEECTGKIALENLRPSWLVFSDGFKKSATTLIVKRAIEVAIAAVALVVCLPILLILAAAIVLTSPGPAIYSQLRVGQNGRVFRVYKLRSMRNDAERGTGAVWSVPGDPRITRLGTILRRTRLDELPQLWNILIGNMSLVGPRPERPEFVQELSKQIPLYRLRHVVKPGLTGWAQVRYTYTASVEDTMEKLQHDLFYIKNLSLRLDLFIIFETVKTVVLHRGR